MPTRKVKKTAKPTRNVKKSSSPKDPMNFVFIIVALAFVAVVILFVASAMDANSQDPMSVLPDDQRLVVPGK